MEIDIAGVKTSLTLYELAEWQLKHYKSLISDLHHFEHNTHKDHPYPLEKCRYLVCELAVKHIEKVEKALLDSVKS